MNEYFFELHVTPKEFKEIFIDFLFDAGFCAIEEENEKIILRDDEPLEDVVWALEELSKKLNTTIVTSLNKKQNEDWIKKYQESVEPIEVGSFYVRPSWRESKEGFIDIVVDPALAFGSGHHESTSSCLEILSDLELDKKTFLDVGTGSGILAIAAAKKGAEVSICDTDEMSIISSRENFEKNSLVFKEAWIGSANITKNEYEIVCANIIADILVLIAKDLKKSLKFGGYLILSGVLSQHEEKIIQKYSDLTLEKKITKGDWVTFLYKKI